MKEYQVTLMCSSGKYRPVSCIIKSDEVDLSNIEAKRQLIKQGTQKICAKRYWSSTDLKRYEYTKAKVREYNKAEIEAAAKARYEAIKEEKYNSGEWKRPKSKQSVDK